MREIPGILGRAVQSRLGGRHQPEFRTRTLAENREARFQEALGERAAVVRDLVLVDAGAKCRTRAFKEIEVLQDKWHAGKGTLRHSLLDLPLRVIVVLYDDCVDVRIDLFGTRDRFIQELL